MSTGESQTLKSFPAPRKSESKGRKETAAPEAMGVHEKDQKISAVIMTNNKPSKTLLCITSAEIRLNGSIINWLEIHIYTYALSEQKNRLL